MTCTKPVPMTVPLSVCRYAAAVQDGSQYFVLLIITDGVISDMAQTKEAIVNVSTATAAADLSAAAAGQPGFSRRCFQLSAALFPRLWLTLTGGFMSLWHRMLRILRDVFCSTCPPFLRYFPSCDDKFSLTVQTSGSPGESHVHSLKRHPHRMLFLFVYMRKKKSVVWVFSRSAD